MAEDVTEVQGSVLTMVSKDGLPPSFLISTPTEVVIWEEVTITHFFLSFLTVFFRKEKTPGHCCLCNKATFPSRALSPS